MNTTTSTSSNDVANQIEAAIAKVRRYESALSDAKAELRELRGQVTKTKNAPRECGCGCGNLTSGGTFVPGHDAKLRSRLLREIRDGESEESERAALAELRTYEKLAHGVSEYDLGKVRRERQEKEARKTQREQESANHKSEAQRLKDAAARLKEASRQETHEAGEQRLANKNRALAAAKSGKM
jgi:hypothetical protein